MSISKFLGSFFSLTNENSLALASLRFDFSLVKVEAPTEYSALGHALSKTRKTRAEEGDIHRIARRLGALFEQVIPSTPKLIMTYGLRCSEIIITPGINPQGDASYHGAFHKFVGADGTALWAAATSSIPSLGVYLLACLLADSWDTKEAISIWVELVQSRKEEIQAHKESGHIVTDSSIMSAQQEIPRDDLAKWDASARAWLRSANQAKCKEKDKLRLILRNISIPFNNGANTYQKVIEVWKDSMMGIDNLLCGKPQLVNNRTMLLALSAWHIFPDLIVLGEQVVNVSFKDQLVPRTGVLTVGGWSQSNPEDNASLYWSLALSHLQYYGGSIPVNSEGSEARVNFSQLELVALGSLFGAWGVRRSEIFNAARWIVDTWAQLCSFFDSASDDHLDGLGWLELLARASRMLISSQDSSTSHAEAESLVIWGKRRAKCFLCDDWHLLSPYFGLRNPSMILALSERDDRECLVRYYREVSDRSGDRGYKMIILTCWMVKSSAQKRLEGGNPSELLLSEPVNTQHRKPQGLKQYLFIELSTAVPPNMRSKECHNAGKEVPVPTHARWLSISDSIRRELSPGELQDAELHELVQAWKSKVVESGELPFLARSTIKLFSDDDRDFDERHTERIDGALIKWQQPPLLFKLWQSKDCHSIYSESDLQCHENNTGDAENNCVDLFSITMTGPCPRPYDRSGLFIVQSCSSNDAVSSDVKEVVRTVEAQVVDFGELDSRKLPPLRLYDYFTCLVSEGSAGRRMQRARWYNVNSQRYMWMSELAVKHAPNWRAAASSVALDLASEIYRHLEDASISLNIVERPVSTTQWFHQRDNYMLSPDRDGPPSQPAFKAIRGPLPSRPATFSCIAYFEHGDLNLHPGTLKLVFALAANDSLYVSERLLVDPFETVPEHKVRRIIGNIDRSGISLLVPPNSPRIRRLSKDYRVVKHTPYNNLREDNFKGTSMHLLFSDWSAPIVDVREARSIDTSVVFVESIIRVLDAGEWVADLDILRINFEILAKPTPGSTIDHSHQSHTRLIEYTSIDSWEELLDRPESVGMFRSKGSWVARLAAVSIMYQSKMVANFCIWGPGDYCLTCLAQSMILENPKLPLICID